MIFKLSAILFFSIFTVGCSFMSTERMLPGKSTVTIPVTVALGDVIGTTKSMPVRYYLDDKLYRETVYESVKTSGIFKQVKKNGKAPYILSAKSIDQEYFPGAETFSFIFRIVAKYTLTETKTNQVVFDKTLTSACKKTVSDEFGGPTRVRKATECAVKQNMQKLIKNLSSDKKLLSL